MRIGFLISRLARGGAERQLMRLAGGLAERGHQVEVLCYGGASPLDADLERKGVQVRTGRGSGQLGKIQQARTWMRAFSPDIVHGFMKRASSVAALSRLGSSSCKVIASDLSTATYARHKPSLWGSLLVFGLADRVVTQTELNRKSLETLAPWLRGRTAVVRNGLDTERFVPPEHVDKSEPFRFCAVGSVYRVKNPVRVVQAVAELEKRGVPAFRVDWYGRLGLEGDERPSVECQEALRAAEQLGISSLVRFHGETREIMRAYHSAHALVHASLQEGFPNAVAEGMACGLPVVVSRVSDLPLVIEEARNGFVVDETDPVSIADGMERMMRVSREERRAMGLRSRELAVRWFAQERFLDEYEQLYNDLIQG